MFLSDLFKLEVCAMAAPKISQELHWWLARMVDDLDPESFRVAELVGEFGTYCPQYGYPNAVPGSEKSIRSRISRLIELGYVERFARGQYRVTDAGRDIAEMEEVDQE